MIALIVMALFGLFIYIIAAAINSKEDTSSNLFLIFGAILIAIMLLAFWQIACSDMTVSGIVNAYHDGKLIETIHIEGTDTTRTYKYKKQ